MTPVFAARRRAEEFAALVEAPSTSGPSDARYDELLRLVGTLRETTPVTARPEFVSGLRERLMTVADTALVPNDSERLTLPPRRSARERRIAVAIGGFALVGATTSMAMAAQNALPGDVLYPVKRVMENVEAGLRVGEADQGTTLLASASGRLDEVSALSEDPDSRDTLAIADTLNVFTDQATQASDLLLSDYAQSGQQASISELRDFTADSLAQLTTLEPLVPEAAQDELVRAAQVVYQIDAAAQRACPACAGAGVAEIPSIFAPTSAFDVPDASGTIGQEPARAGHGADGRGDDDRSKDGQDPDVPTVDDGALPPGSVLDPTGTTAAKDPGPGQQAPQPGDDPITDLTDGLTGGGSAGTSNPGAPDLGDPLDDPVDDVGDVVDDVLAPVTGDLTP